MWGNDDTLKTPHADAVDLSIGRELPQRFSLQFSYVGRFGHRLLTQRDLNQPLDIVDPKTGIDYYAAASALSTLARKFALANQPGPNNFYQGSVTPAQISTVTATMVGPTAQYWVDMLPALRPGASHYEDPSLPALASQQRTLRIACYARLRQLLQPGAFGDRRRDRRNC